MAVEFTSMSKTYAMAGWRIGFAVGNTKLIHALTRIKSYLDYGAFTPVQVAAASALNGPQSCVEDIRNTYQRRRDVLITSMARSGWDIPKPQASMFAWAPLPEKYKSKGSLEFAKELMLKADVAVAPGVPAAILAIPRARPRRLSACRGAPHPSREVKVGVSPV